MPLRKDLRKVMVIGSGPIVIGQAAEFDYAGTQACRALREEGLEVVLINSNPATIMTDANMADRVYIEPLTPEFVMHVLRKERPQGLLPTLGGQTGLNLGKQVAESGILEELGIELLGTSLETIKRAEDRELFKRMMQDIDEPIPESEIVESVEAALAFAASTGYPLVVRPAYTLGGTGGGIVFSREELIETAARGLKASLIHQILVEQCVIGWKEIEFEVIRDGADNCITICSMENIDPMGVHTGDSIVVAPTQTLNDKEYQMLRSSSLKIIRALGVEGGCNVQFALDPQSMNYFVIEVNPRVSRSSALASKATGYPIAKVASKIAIGLHLDEIRNAVTGKTSACFEPVIDYVVVKFPRWPFDKFAMANRRLGTQMKSTGEVMAIGRTLEATMLKAVRSLEIGAQGFSLPEAGEMDDKALRQGLSLPDDRRMFLVAEALRRGIPADEVSSLSNIDPFFVRSVEHIVNLEQEVQSAGFEGLDAVLLRRAKRVGLADQTLASLTHAGEDDIRGLRNRYDIHPVYKMVDTCAGEFEADTPYYYSAYEDEDEVRYTGRRRVVVLGSGPIRIGQGIEFDYCSVHAVWALRQAGLDAVIINCNPETVSTDFDTGDRLYFEPLVAEDVIEILRRERPEGVVVQFGGQTAINLARAIEDAGFTILGTSVDDIDAAEDRERFDCLLNDLDIPRPPGGTGYSVEEAQAIAQRIGFPVLVRPSYVLGGRAMEIVYNEKDLLNYMVTAVKITPEHPVLVDKYLFGKELEVDAVSDGKDVVIPGLMEHIERAGVHSGDSIAVFPPQQMSKDIRQQMVDYTVRLAQALHVKGLLNIQYVQHNGSLYVLEVNPRSSRTVPYLSKITGVSMVSLATRVLLGESLSDMGYRTGLLLNKKLIGVKAPVFSFAKLLDVDVSLGPEMKSTGEVLGVAEDYAEALYKASTAAGYDIPKHGTALVTVADKDKDEAVSLVSQLLRMGFEVLATHGTAVALEAMGIEVKRARKLHEGSPHIVDLIRSNRINLVINTLTQGKAPERDGFRIRRAAVEMGIPCFTSLDTASAIIEVLESRRQGEDVTVLPIQEFADH